MDNNVSFLNIPNEIMINILVYLDWESIQRLKLVNRRLYQVCESPIVYERAMKMDYGKWILNPKLVNGCMNFNINMYDLKIVYQIDTLISYIYKSQWTIVKFLIRHIIEPYAKNKNGDTLDITIVKTSSCYLEMRYVLHCVIKQKDLCNRIINKHNTNIHGRSILIYSCLNNDLDNIKMILECPIYKDTHTHADARQFILKRDKYGWNAIMYAIVYNKCEIVEFLQETYNLVLSKMDILEISIYIKTRNIVQGRWNMIDTLRRIREIEDFEEDEIPLDYRTVLSHFDTDQTNSQKSVQYSDTELSDKIINEEEVLEKNLEIITGKKDESESNLDGTYIKYTAMEKDTSQWLEDIYFVYQNSTDLHEKKHIIMKIYNTIFGLGNSHHQQNDNNNSIINTQLLFDINTRVCEIHSQIREKDTIWKQFIKENNIQIT